MGEVPLSGPRRTHFLMGEVLLSGPRRTHFLMNEVPRKSFHARLTPSFVQMPMDAAASKFINL